MRPDSVEVARGGVDSGDCPGETRCAPLLNPVGTDFLGEKCRARSLPLRGVLLPKSRAATLVLVLVEFAGGESTPE
jgi:hypothetical protein